MTPRKLTVSRWGGTASGGEERAGVGRTSGGFTMIEAVLATVMVAVLLTAALNTVGASRGGQVRTSQQTIAHMLAADLISEIVQMPYADPNEASVLGLELSELGKARLYFDDVDDYHALSESPPKLRDGTTMTEFTGYSRHVTVEYAQAGDLTQTAALDSGIKRVRVEVQHGGKLLCRVSAVRAAAVPNPVTGAISGLLQ